MRLLITISLFCSVVFSGFSQLSTTIQNPVTLVQNVLLGDPGITVSNISFQGAPGAIGSFSAPNTNLGIQSGIIITTGNISGNGNGPLGPNNSPSAGHDNGTGGYGLLTGIVGNSTHNASVLSFDFQTCSDSIEFRYVFGSEEYPEYVGSQFNDIFGFFISGPGFAGQQNIARLPNGSVVAINNVNNGNTAPAAGVNPTGPSNPQYFVPNGNGSQTPYNQSNIYIQYDGFTRVLTAKAKIQCNATYRLTLAIADVGDPFFDSGIFLEAKSFKSTDPLKVSYSVTNRAFNEPNVLAEPCSEARVRLSRTNCNISNPLTVNIATSGTAVNGVDYQTVAPSVTIPAGSLFTEFNLRPLLDELEEGTESVLFTFNYLDNCGEPQTQQLELFIRDIESMTLELSANEGTCPGDDIVISSTVTGGGQPYRYLWNTGDTTSVITVNPMVTETYTLSVLDQCIGQTTTRSITINVPVYTPIVIASSPDITELCPYLPATLTASASGGFGGYTYQWSSNGVRLGTANTQTVTPERTTTYTVTVTDMCGITESHDITYTITSLPLILELNPDVEICPGDSVHLTSLVMGGYGQYYYHWPHSGETTPDVWVNPSVSTNYLLVVSDECQTFSVAKMVRVIVVKPTANFQVSSGVLFNNLELTFQNLSINADTYEWDFGDGNTSTDVHPSNTYTNPGDYVVTLIATDDKGCKDTIRIVITVLEEYYIYVPNTFTPGNDRINEVFKASTVNISNLKTAIYNRWGERIFTSDKVDFEWDGTYKGAPVLDGTYTYKMGYVTRTGIEGKIVGHVNVLR
jgi:gliding motility-associated-like protein